jgi:UDP-N-acetylglucosamine--N-acetylmuramyl-(pentapeptide) pyrophosphoryl-undecaprenol N-acetylglucosamine transferase
MASPERNADNVIVLAAGGTGGHLFPAQALAEELQRRGYLIHLITDSRVSEFGKDFPAERIYDVPSATVTLKSPWKLPGRLFRLMHGYVLSKAVLRKLKPRAIVGFGGYPSFPPLAAAARLRLPIILHEANAVLGRANMAIAKRASLIASSFPTLTNLPAALQSKVQLTGNPVRSQVLKFAGAPYDPPAAEKTFRLLVFGGSQGAQFFSELVPAAIAELPGVVRRNIAVTQQCRPEDVEAVRARYEELGVEGEVAHFFADLPQRMTAAHLVICRSGASTIAELTVIGRPAILVPLPHSVDSDQLRNAESFANGGGGWLLRQSELTAESLAATLMHLRYEETELTDAARAALDQGRPDATERLADAVAALAAPPVNVFIPETIGVRHEATS